MAEDKQSEARNRNLLRFIHAQDSGGLYDGTGTYQEALQEVKAGHKKGHWIWYIFPQMKGLGHSEISEFYGINGREEAKAYIEHPVLKERLVEICEAVLNSQTSVYDIRQRYHQGKGMYITLCVRFRHPCFQANQEQISVVILSFCAKVRK